MYKLQISEIFLALLRMYMTPFAAIGIFRHLDSGYRGGGGYVCEFMRFSCQAKNSVYDKNNDSFKSLNSLILFVKHYLHMSLAYSAHLVKAPFW